MTLEAIMTEIRDEIKESNKLKREQNKAFEGYSLNEDYEKDKEETETKEETKQPASVESPKQDEQKPAEVRDYPDESEMKKAVAKIIKGKDADKKEKLKSKIKEIGAKKVSDIKPEQRQIIIEYVKVLENE